MARPRRYARVKLVGGVYVLDKSGPISLEPLSVNKPTGELYHLVDGSRKYIGKNIDAIARQHLSTVKPDVAEVARRQLQDFGVEPDRMTPEAITDYVKAGDACKRQEVILALGGSMRYAESHPDVWQDFERDLSHPTGPPEQERERNRRAEHWQNIMREARGQTPPETGPTGADLKGTLKLWREMKEEERLKEQSIKDVERSFTAFIKLVGNKWVSQLTDDDFAKWRRHVIRRTTAENKTGKWHNDQHTYVAGVFHAVKSDKPSWGWRSEMAEWLTGWKRMKYVPDRSNAKRLPVDVFNRLILACAAYTSDPDEHDTATQTGKAKRLQAERHNVEGMRLACILKITANAALANVDICRMEWRHLRLEAPIPYLDFAREKTLRTAGFAVERKTPLLPSVVKALRELQELHGHSPFVFRTANGSPYTSGGLDTALRKLLRLAKVEGFTFKHLRNIAPSLGKEHKRPKEERDTILGHTTKDDSSDTTKFYEDEVSAKWLVPLVNIVGQAYFGGEQIAEPKQTSGQINDRT